MKIFVKPTPHTNVTMDLVPVNQLTAQHRSYVHQTDQLNVMMVTVNKQVRNVLPILHAQVGKKGVLMDPANLY